MSRAACLVSIVLSAALFCRPQLASAQADDIEVLGRMSEEELEAEGWRYQSDDPQPGSILGGILALSVGTVVHGVGHFYAGDGRTGRILLITEGISAGMFLLGVAVEGFSNSDGSLAWLYESLYPLSVALFATTWLFDVVGTFKGKGGSFGEPRRSVSQLSLSGSYTYLDVGGLPIEHATVVELRADLWPFYIYPRGTVGLGHDFQQFGASTGIRFGFGSRDLSYGFLEAQADRFLFNELGFSYWSLLGALGLSVDLGDVFSHLDGLIFGLHVGGGAQLHQFDFDEEGGTTSTAFLVVGSSLAINPVDELMLEAGYVERPDGLLGNLSHSVGSFFGTLTYALGDQLDVYVDARAGRGVQVFSGTVFYFFR